MASAKVRLGLGTLGSVATFAGFYAGQMGVVKDLQGTHGIMGLAVAGAAAVIVSLVAGLLPMITRAENPIHALLLGTTVPAILFAAGIPTFGVPPKNSPGYDAAVKKPFKALWLAVTPVNAILRQRAEGVADDTKSAVDRALAEAKGAAEKDKAAAVQQAKAAGDEAVQAAVNEAKASEEAKRGEAAAAAIAAAAKDKEAAVSAAREEGQREQAAALEAQRQQFELEKQKMSEGLAELESLREASARATAEAADANQKAQEALARVGGVERDLADHRRFAGWIESDLDGVKTPSLRVLGRRLASRDVEERKTAARLLPMCGPAARDLLQKAVADSDADVREIVKASLEKLSR